MKTIALVLLAAAGCAEQSSYLGAELPKTCHGGDAERCIGWMAARDLSAAELDTYNDPALTQYVQGIVNRLARISQLADAPVIEIANHEASYATLGGRIVIGRQTIQRLGSEAELAAVLAHELAHLEGHHSDASLSAPRTDAAWLERRRDAEAIADERAILLLERAGYATDALARALDRVLEADDAEHPPRTQRIERAHALSLKDDRGFDGKTALDKHLEHTVVGREAGLGGRLGDAWVVGALGIAFQLRETDVVTSDEDVLIVRRGGTTLTAYAVGVRTGPARSRPRSMRRSTRRASSATSRAPTCRSRRTPARPRSARSSTRCALRCRSPAPARTSRSSIAAAPRSSSRSPAAPRPACSSARLPTPSSMPRSPRA